MKTMLLLLLFLLSLHGAAQPPAWEKSQPGWRYKWPRDHASHAGFKTEWWYFTGNLRSADGERHGYQLTFFRQGVRPPGSEPVRSRFVVNDFALAHFAMTDVSRRRFAFAQRLSRGAFGEAGFGDGEKEPRLAWNGTWKLERDTAGIFHLHAEDGDRALTLSLSPSKPLILHGHDGISPKSELPGYASHYYSATRLRSEGTLRWAGREIPVTGESWYDHEWASNQLAPGQVGWDWFSLQFTDGTELMLFQLRRSDGTADGATSGTWISADGTTRPLSREDITLAPLRHWQSPRSGGKYPIAWHITVAPLALALEISTPVPEQELYLQPIAYWEGIIDARGTRGGQPVHAHGYLEMTGYSGPIVGLSSGP